MICEVKENLTIETIWSLLRCLPIALHFIWKSLHSTSLSLWLPLLSLVWTLGFLLMAFKTVLLWPSLLVFMWFWLTIALIPAWTFHDRAVSSSLLPDTGVFQYQISKTGRSDWCRQKEFSTPGTIHYYHGPCGNGAPSLGEAGIGNVFFLRTEYEWERKNWCF